MKILFDIGHPAHIHYFKHTIRALEKKGHEVLISARNRKELIDLLDSFGFPYINRGNGASTMSSKLMKLPQIDWQLFKIAKKFRPDLVVSFGSIYAAHVSILLRIPHIMLTDTEVSRLYYLLSVPFSDLVVTPQCFGDEFGKKHIRFPGTIELSYLLDAYYQHDESALELLGVQNGEKYIVTRFVANQAYHDSGISVLTEENKIQLIKSLTNSAKVFISSELPLPADLEPYRLKIPQNKFHDAIYFADAFFGDAGTTAIEAALLGVPSIRCADLQRANPTVLRMLETEYGLIKQFAIEELSDAESAIKGILQNDSSKSMWLRKRDAFLKNSIDPTQLLIWLIENYPESKNELLNSPQKINTFLITNSIS